MNARSWFLDRQGRINGRGSDRRRIVQSNGDVASLAWINVSIAIAEWSLGYRDGSQSNVSCRVEREVLNRRATVSHNYPRYVCGGVADALLKSSHAVSVWRDVADGVVTAAISYTEEPI